MKRSCSVLSCSQTSLPSDERDAVNPNQNRCQSGSGIEDGRKLTRESIDISDRGFEPHLSYRVDLNNFGEIGRVCPEAEKKSGRVREYLQMVNYTLLIGIQQDIRFSKRYGLRVVRHSIK